MPHTPMLIWLLAMYCLVSAMMAPAESGLGSIGGIPRELQMAVLSNLDFVSLSNCSVMSQDFRKLALSILKQRYGIKCNGKFYSTYTTLLRKYDVLQYDAFKGRSADEARKVLEDSSDYAGINVALKAEFGICASCPPGHRAKFSPKQSLMGILHDDKQASALPYLLDENPEDPLWEYCIRGIVELMRFDLLDLITFPRLCEHHFSVLLSIPLPTHVFIAAARGLEKSNFDLPLSKLVSFAVLQGLGVHAPEGPVPLFALQYMHENKTTIPSSWIFTDGLLDSSIPFWMYLMRMGAEEFQHVLCIIMERGDDATQCMARVFSQVVPSAAVPMETEDVYQAILVRFRFSPHSNRYVEVNYESMIKEPLVIGYHSMNALIECGQFELISRFEFVCTRRGALQGLMMHLYRLGNEKLLHLVVNKYIDQNGRAPDLLKTLLEQRVADWYVQLVWDRVNSDCKNIGIVGNCCSAPVDSLKRLMFDEHIPIDDIDEMLSKVQEQELQTLEEMIPREAALLYTVIFWEAPEKVIIHYLDQVASDYSLEFTIVWELKWSTKYSHQLWKRLAKHCGKVGYARRREVQLFRPDLLSLFN